MSEEILKVEDLNVNIEEKSILHNVSLSINKGETHVIMGPNGAGKSTLGHSIMGNPKFEIISGKIVFKGEDITEESVDKRALSGLYLSFQNPLEVPGISLSNFIKLAVEQKTGERLKLLSFRKGMDKTLSALSMDASYANPCFASDGKGICRQRFECRIFRRRKEKVGDLSADGVKAGACHT